MSALSKRVVLAALFAACVATTAVACSNGEDSGLAPDEASADGGGPDAPASSSADASDASSDASSRDADADTGDAQPRTCSDDDVCHTALPPASFLRDVWSAGDGIVWAVGWRDGVLNDAPGFLLRWDGKAWAEATKDAHHFNAVWGSSATDIWVGGDSGLFHGTGASSAALGWMKVRSEPITSIWGSSANDVWAVGSSRSYVLDGKVLHYSGPDAGGSDGWEIDPISLRPLAFRKVWGTSAGDVWIGAHEDGSCAPYCYQGAHALTLHRRKGGDGGGSVWSDQSMPELGAAGQGSNFTGGGSVTPNDVFLFGNLSTDYFTSPDAIFAGTPKSDGSGDFAWNGKTFGTCRGNPPCQGLWFTRAVWGKSADDFFLAGDFGQLRHWNGTGFSLVKTTVEKIPVIAPFFAMWGSSSSDLWIVGNEIALHKTTPSKH